MTFSIIVPIYNVEKYLKRCLDSILNQTCQDFELILINDGSTDKSGRICEYYKEHHTDKIIYIQQENGGLSHARNVGLNMAKGEYIIFVDSDDYVKNDMLDIIRCYRTDNQEMIGYQHKALNDTSNSKHHLNMIDGIQCSGQDYLKEVCNKKQLYMMAQKYAYKKSFLKENQLLFHEGIIHEDEEWTLKALCLAKHFTFIDKELYFYEDIRSGSIMNVKNLNSDRSYITVAAELSKFIQSTVIQKDLKKMLKHKIFDMYYYHVWNILNEYIVSENKFVLKNYTNLKEFIKGKYLLCSLRKE